MKRFISYLRYLRHITAGFHSITALRTILGIIRVALMLTFIWLSKTAIDCATGRLTATTASLATWFALMVACMLADVAISQIVRYIETRTTMRMNNIVNRRLFNYLMTMPLVNGRQGFHSADMINRLTLDVRTVTTFALAQLPTIIVMAVQLIAAFAFLAWLNPYLALAPVIIMPLCVLASKLYFRRQRQLTARIRQAESDINVTIQEGLKHRIVIRTLQCISEIDRRLTSTQQQLDNTNHQQARLTITSGALVRLGFILGYLTAFGWSIFSLKAGIITFGTMSAFIQLVSRIQNPIANLAGYIPTFISTSVAVDRLREIYALTPITTEVQHDASAPLTSAGIRVSDVTFRYDTDDANIITSFSHDFKPGSRTMIVGSTGAGKTTLIKLLLGLLKPHTGSIELYTVGHTQPIDSTTLANFVYVPQGNTLLHGTIRDNLLLANPQATDQQIAEALHIAVADFAYTLPLGLDTPCDEVGGGLSEGQAQRIAIARALLRPGTILLLDEFNSALDTATAATLIERLTTSRPHATIIIIAHHHTTIAPYCPNIITIPTPQQA